MIDVVVWNDIYYHLREMQHVCSGAVVVVVMTLPYSCD